MNIELKPIAESKVRQLGGDVCGVLVRTDDGEVMAVSEHGRCTRLDAGVMGPVDGAQGGQGAEAVAWCWEYRGLHVSADKAFVEKLAADGFAIRPLVYADTQPQPAVPEDEYEHLHKTIELLTKKLIRTESAVSEAMAAQDFYESDDFLLSGDLHACEQQAEGWNKCRKAMLALLSTPTTPQADGWIRCDERLPTLGQRVQLFSQGVVQHMMPLLDEGDEGLFWDFEVHDYNPPVDLARDQWRPLPQPPKQEGSGDEH